MFFKSLLPAFLWALFILIICGIPGHRLPRVDFLQWLKPDKLVHLFVYATLCFLLIRGFTKQESVTFFKASPKLWAIIFSICYGILIEFLQEYIFIDRNGDVFDALANSLGAFIGMWSFYFIRKKSTVRDSSST